MLTHPCCSLDEMDYNSSCNLAGLSLRIRMEWRLSGHRGIILLRAGKTWCFFYWNCFVWGQCVLNTQLYTHKFLYLSDPALFRISTGQKWNGEVSPTPSGKLLKQLPISTKVRPSLVSTHKWLMSLIFFPLSVVQDDYFGNEMAPVTNRNFKEYKNA